MFVITGVSFLICNLGLSTILNISVPILNAIYPVSIVLILLGLSHVLWKQNSYVYPLTVAGTGLVSVVYALDTAGVPLGALGTLARRLPLYSVGFGWVCAAAVMLCISIVGSRFSAAPASAAKPN